MGFLNNSFEEFSAFHELHDQVEEFISLNKVQQTHHVRVRQTPHDLSLIPYVLFLFRIQIFYLQLLIVIINNKTKK